MKKLLLSLLTLIIIGAASAQSKKETVSSVDVNAPTMSLIYQVFDEQGNPLGTIDLQIYDRQRQLDDISIRRMNDQLRGNDPIRPKIKIIAMPEVGPAAFRLAESMDEISKPVDNKTVLLVDYTALLDAMRTKYS